MDFKVLLDADYPTGGLTFTKNTDIRTSIYNSINVKKGSFFQDREFGCDLYLIKKLTAANLLLARQYIQEALKWLLETGRATSIDVIVEKDLSDSNRMNIKVTAKQPDGLILTFEQFQAVI